MGIVNKRNAVVGWIVLKLGKRAAKKKAQGAVPGRAPAASQRAPSPRSAVYSSSGARSAAEPQASERRALPPLDRAISSRTSRASRSRRCSASSGSTASSSSRRTRGPFPPFPAALEAIERAARELNRYPDGGV